MTDSAPSGSGCACPLQGELRLRPQGIGDELLLALRLKREHKVDDHDFDGLFVIQGDAEMTELLTPEVRSALLRLAKFDIPSVDVTSGVASISWRWELDPQAFEAALEVLIGLRTPPPTLRLREEGDGTAPLS